jgi:PEP-CTERM motif
MNSNTNGRFSKAILMLAGGILALHLSSANCSAVVLFNETFEGYTSFPVEDPPGYVPEDMVNPGIPEISEGASEFWYGVRFQAPGAIESNLVVQEFGGGINQTHVARFAHDSGIVLRIDTTGYYNVNLSFMWRMFEASTPDRFTAGYHVGDDLGFTTSGPNRYLNLTSGPNSWANGWTQLLSGNAGNSWSTRNSTLPSDAGPVYVAFWLNDGHDDYGKLDNILITATPIIVPEPSTLVLGVIGVCAFAIRRKLQP